MSKSTLLVSQSSSLPFEEPVFVQSKELDLGCLPDWSAILEDMPVGVGVKGGIARKILKVISGLNGEHPDFAAEMDGNGDIDIVVAVPRVSADLRLAIRQHFTGMKFGEMQVMAKDIEVSDNLERYFRVRDVTMNEVLAFRVSHNTVMLYFTATAQQDIKGGLISPSIHCLHTKFGQVWRYDERGRFVICQSFDRCLIRWLKGHGLYYGIPMSTWDHYRERKLGLRSIFRIFKNFVGDEQKFRLCHRHLAELGLIARDSDPNLLWGSAMFNLNARLAKFGKRLSFVEPDAKQIEDWILRKEQEFCDWQFDRSTRVAMGMEVEPDTEAQVFLPDGLKNFPAFYGQ